MEVCPEIPKIRCSQRLADLVCLKLNFSTELQVEYFSKVAERSWNHAIEPLELSGELHNTPLEKLERFTLKADTV